ncbi:hypothetical protein LCGC14_2323370 [marine sediment metagenome]|uniref:Uncharacterized protein n=1 Tax=marine sediment metagenome TaxID=412755 RepID=A0A0F9CHP2_9ZZZZ
MPKQNKEDEISLYGLLGLIVGINIFILINPLILRNMIFLIIFWLIFLFVIYKCISFIVEHKKYKHAFIVMISTYSITIISAIIRVLIKY